MIGKTIEIDLTEYGDENAKIVLAPMSGSARNRMLNEVGRCCNVPMKKGTIPTMDRVASGDVQIIMLMAYVKSAPFEPTLKGFLGYMDKLDEKEIGKGCELQDRIAAEVEKIAKGDLSPLSNSQAAETPSSA